MHASVVFVRGYIAQWNVSMSRSMSEQGKERKGKKNDFILIKISNTTNMAIILIM